MTAAGPLAGQSSSGAWREAAQQLSQSVRDLDVTGFLDALAEVLSGEDSRSVRLAVESYARLADELCARKEWSAFHYLHQRTAAAFSRISDKSAIRELDSLRRRGRAWRARLLAIDVAALHSDLDLEACCLDALHDESPAVVRRALHYLARDRKIPVVERIVARFLALEESRGKRARSDEESSEWSRTLFAFRSALQQLLGVDLPAAIDWKNYVETRKESKDFFRPPGSSGKPGLTEITLFGAAVTGKNIVFILDVSGSMVIPDPPPADDLAQGPSGRTVVGDPRRRAMDEEMRESRRRIRRAKKELTRVVRSLPDDVRFNLIAYSSDVRPWKKLMVRATKEAKEAAAKFIEELEAEGITVTDMAIEEAFTDLDIDTIYLLTDGAPTHVGGTTDSSSLPPDARDLIEKIHGRVAELNFLRGVRIFCLGFRGAEEKFLEKLSVDHGGQYVRIR
ncbi:MAG: VWA domain-containing protein [Planctomycetes bacterium]|nr:VWA domain-containing protein [Planctomycetota bacterium]